MSDYITRVTRKTIVPKGEPIFSEMATHVSVRDDAAGEYIEIKQDGEEGNRMVRFNPDEWQIVKTVVDEMFDEIMRWEARK